MNRSLDGLDRRFRPLAMELIARCAEAGIAVCIVNTLRTPAEQAAALSTGHSKTQNSKHLPQPPDGLSLAIDLCPFEQYYLHGAKKLDWDSACPAWQKMGNLGEALGLRWGGRWEHLRDMGHFEYAGE